MFYEQLFHLKAYDDLTGAQKEHIALKLGVTSS